MDFLLLIKENGGKITRSDQDMFDAVRYYVMTKYLSDVGLIYCNGVTQLGNQKIWSLTTKGEKISDLLKEIHKIYYDYDKDVVSDAKKKGKGVSAR
jgi:predicted transcriptional regulator